MNWRTTVILLVVLIVVAAYVIGFSTH